MENNPEETLPNLSQFANPDESVLGIDQNPDEEKPAGAAELMTPDDAPGPKETD